MNDNKVALVTGATRGIGLAIADKLMSLGINVVGTSRNKETISKIANNKTTGEVKMVGYAVDLLDKGSIMEFLEELKKDDLQPDILVNNAAVTRDNLLLRMKSEDWEEVISANLQSVYYITSALIRSMVKKRYGRIVNIASVVGISGNAGQANYVASKAGLIGFTKSVALEVATRGITVNTISPGFISTDMTNQLSDAQRDVVLQKIPMGRTGSAIDVAEAVGFLVSSGAGYITGENININGGMLMI